MRVRTGAKGGRVFHASAVRGFTLLEVMVAVAITALAFAMAWSTFSAALDGWRRGTRVLDQLHRGEHVMEQLVTALRSAAFFSSRPDKYGFWLESHGGGEEAADVFSWVVSGSTLLPSDSPLAHGLYRVEVGLERDARGRGAIAVRAWPHLAEEEDRDVRGKPWIIAGDVQGLRCRVYDVEDEAWEDEWENTNSLPRLVELTLYLPPVEKYEPATTIQRLVEIPMAPPLSDRPKGWRGPSSSSEGQTEATP